MRFSKRKKRKKNEFNAENVAKTLAGYQNQSLSGAVIESLQKGIRMVVFLIMPAIAWEGLRPIAATKKSFFILRTRLKQFATGYALTFAAAVVIFLPVYLINDLFDRLDLEVPDGLWVLEVIYIGFGWSFSLYIEQMFMAGLYIWHIKWEWLCKEAEKKGAPVPEFTAIRPPEILKALPELKRFFDESLTDIPAPANQKPGQTAYK